MAATVQIGTILIADPSIFPVLGLESELYSGNWSVIKALDSFARDRKIHAVGWNFFFMAAEVKALIFDAIGPKNIQNALRRILGKMRRQNFKLPRSDGDSCQAFSGCALCHRFGTPALYPTELLLGSRRGTADVPARRRVG